MKGVVEQEPCATDAVEGYFDGYFAEHFDTEALESLGEYLSTSQLLGRVHFKLSDRCVKAYCLVVSVVVQAEGTHLDRNSYR
jgi:hypothetical protein